MKTAQEHCDLLVISPHTDDAEIGLGGTIATMAAGGRKVWAVDLTRGELATNATPEQRWEEAASASSILGLQGRLQLTLPDGFINASSRDHLDAVVWALRTLRPRIVVTAPDPVRHPDHIATRELVQKAVFLSRLQELATKAPLYHRWNGGDELPPTQNTWIVSSLFSVCPDALKPSLLFDVSENWHRKEKALASYASQFKMEDGRNCTHINDGGFLEKISRRAQRWGDRAGTTRAEAFRTENIPVVNDFDHLIEWRP